MSLYNVHLNSITLVPLGIKDRLKSVFSVWIYFRMNSQMIIHKHQKQNRFIMKDYQRLPNCCRVSGKREKMAAGTLPSIHHTWLSTKIQKVSHEKVWNGTILLHSQVYLTGKQMRNADVMCQLFPPLSRNLLISLLIVCSVMESV